LLLKAENNLASLGLKERDSLQDFLDCELAKLCEFPSPFAKCFSYSNSYWNIRHKKTQGLVQSIIRMKRMGLNNELSKADLGKINDLFSQIENWEFGHGFESYQVNFRNFYDSLVDYKVIDSADAHELVPQYSDFVPDTMRLDRFDEDQDEFYDISDYITYKIDEATDYEDFGALLDG
jgi:hypothetical protein